MASSTDIEPEHYEDNMPPHKPGMVAAACSVLGFLAFLALLFLLWLV